jgi:hypothetical protein
VNEHSLTGRTTPSKRRYPRVKRPAGVRVYWRCEGLEDTSPVRDLSAGGLFLETGETRALGTTIRLEFLVQEGAIRAEAVLRYVRPGRGMGGEIHLGAPRRCPRAPDGIGEPFGPAPPETSRYILK